MRMALVIAGLLVSLAAAPQEIYKWVDRDGVVHFADQPGAPDAKLTPYRSRAEAEPETASPSQYPAPPPPPPEEPAGPAYESLRIASPTPDQVFFGTDAVVAVQLELDRDLRPGDKAIVSVDGVRLPEFEGLSTTVTGLARGTHFLSAAVIDDSGKAMITSAQITFYLRQTSVTPPPTGPAITPRSPGTPRAPATTGSN